MNNHTIYGIIKVKELPLGSVSTLSVYTQKSVPPSHFGSSLCIYWDRSWDYRYPTKSHYPISVGCSRTTGILGLTGI